ncbi:uncharacterized protein [Lepeophtheirus salmonis]|uniref:uncharacterized protein n=1 Tax=Lepeophtheirus salmonis TaxID=72036 RepID=UPI001AE4CD10|nr:uncharacterized protein LOC121115768 [Lepeophtheirus salmonis]
MSHLTRDLLAPKSSEDFNKEWARKVLVSYFTKTDKDWLLADVLKVVDLTITDNENPGMLSNSYVLDVYYRNSKDSDLISESWFVKVPKSVATSPMDAVEIFAYKELFPKLSRIYDAVNVELRLPVPLMLHCCHRGDGKCDILVLENLHEEGYEPLKPGTCGLSYMRATMRSLATIHATTAVFLDFQGGKDVILNRFKVIKDHTLPKSHMVKDIMQTYLLPYIIYLSVVQPDLQHQLSLLLKFHKHMYSAFRKVKKEVITHLGKTLIHGDSKIDNFMYKKITYSLEEEYSAQMIDWQGICLDYVTGDLIWTLYGFMKNLPDKNATVDTYVDYSLEYYHRELLSMFKTLGVKCSLLPEDEYDAIQAIQKGFIYEFMKTVLVKPLFNLKNPEELLKWSINKVEGKDGGPPPSLEDVFKSGSSFANFIHLYFTIATEIGVFHELGELCIASMRESIFSGGEEESEDSEVEDHGETPIEQTKDPNESLLQENKEQNVPLVEQNINISETPSETRTEVLLGDVQNEGNECSISTSGRIKDEESDTTDNTPSLI